METHHDDLSHPKKRKHVYENIANELISLGFKVTAIQCQVKWKSLVRTYTTTKDNKNKTGRGPTRFQFFEEMDSILGTKPSNQCNHSLESSTEENNNEGTSSTTINNNEGTSSATTNNNGTGQINGNANEEVTDTEGGQQERERQRSVRTKKRKRNEDYLKEKQNREDERKARHRERMEMEREKINIEREKIALFREYLERKK